MEDLIAKKYAKAILTRNDANEFYELMLKLVPAFSLDKFKLILNSYDIKKEEKLNIIMSFFEKTTPNFTNFIRLLAHNSRLNLIPQIVEELRKQKALKEQLYSGTVFSQDSISLDKITELEQKLSKKFNVSIKLDNQITNMQGIKISLDELGYEISFSMQGLKTKMSDYILKTL
ncbi:F0F1 ATP synthase subunit delta [Campylobacter troglodytis]|uniref:F0F1 ATP synthase subunit delta n=1 Tax=Campylobacter troglodytis TaxID=654363 RepID=UPI00115A5C87|nr:F0F1 ATP synthase subunit delta [Campylobacter troglodytis]TQR61385.1 ATP F0F1 synthase subunit delta [Campylobacter troglodytis]